MSKKTIALWVCTLMMASGAALATPRQNQPPPAPPPDTQGQQVTVPAPQPTADASQKVSEYNTQAQALQQIAPNPRHPAEIKALRALADALDAMPGTEVTKQSADSIRKSADTLEKSKVTEVHSDTTKEALTYALASLDAMNTATAVPGLADKIKAAHDAIAKIDPSLPFLKEKEIIDDAFVKIGDALLLANQPAVGMVEKQPVRGQEEPETPRQEIREFRQKALFDTQVAVVAGGGYASFGAKGLRDITQNGGEWDFRAIIGAHTVFGAELAYVGTANELNGRMPGINSNAVIVSNAFEGNLRLATPALRIVPVQLFGFVGAGYNRFSLTNKNGFQNTSPIADSDTTFVLPAGGGLQLNIGNHVAVDGRFTYRAQFDENLFGRDHNADQYTATARVGYVF